MERLTRHAALIAPRLARGYTRVAMHLPEADNPLAKETPTRARFTLSAWFAGAAAIAYVCRQCLAVAEKTIRLDLGLSEAQMGLIIGLFFWSYALAQIPAARLGERFGSRICVPAFAAAWSVAMLGCAATLGAVLFFVGRAIAGVAQAGLFPCAADTISRWNAATERALASGFLAAAMQAGAVIAAPLTVLLLDVVSWRVVFAAYALPGLAWAIGFYWWFRDRIEDHPSANAAEVALVKQGRPVQNPAVHQPEGVPWGRLFRSGTMWLICGQQFFRAAAYVWFASWFATYLQETRDVTREASGWLNAIPLLASLVAALISGGLSDWVLLRTGSRALARKGVALSSLIVCSLLVFGAYFIPDPQWATLSIGAGAFFAACAGPSAYATTIDLGGRHVASVFATMNMAGNFGSALLSTLVPQFRQLINRSPALLEFFDGNSWNAVLVLFGTMYLLAALCWLPLREHGSVFDESSPSEALPENTDKGRES
ncbi:MAG: MFS transporter [Planctomycetaceae bacterium]|nr:MFS transporter [Planctomycetaceae bacterium]